MALLLRTHYNLAKESIRQNRTRSFLTCLGIAIGVASIILTYSLPFWAVSLIALAFVLVFSLVNLLLLLTQYKKLYAKMEI